ncbi:MAG: hypothetical protein ACHQIK_06035 [Candidatus Acidiferrales bacterium]
MMSKERNKETSRRASLREQVLLAALDCCGSDLEKAFTSEDLLVSAWKRDPLAFGLRGYEREYPDSDKVRKELDSRGARPGSASTGLVSSGLILRVRERIYRLTPTGLAAAAEVVGAEPDTRGRAERVLADAVDAILSHSVLRGWLKDPSSPRLFRDAGHFWGVAPGTPPKVIQARIMDVDRTLEKALGLLDADGVDEVTVRHGKALFDRTGIERAMNFQAMLKERFAKDLSTLQVKLT